MQIRDKHIRNGRILTKGDTLIVRGPVKTEMTKVYLTPAIAKDSDNPTFRTIFGTDADQ